MRKIALLTVLSALLLIRPAMAAYMCEDQNGRKSFQDKPCKANEYSQTLELKTNPTVNKDVVNTTDYSTVAFSLDEESHFSFSYPTGWDHKIESYGKNMAEKKIVLRAQDNKTVLLFMVRKFRQPIPNIEGKLKSLVDGIRAQKNGIEITYNEMPYDLMNNALSALMVTHEKRMTNPKAEFISTDHIIVSDKYAVRGNLLALDVLSANYATALSVLTQGITEQSKNNSPSESFSFGIPNGIQVLEANHSGRPSYKVTTDDSNVVLVLPKENIPYQTVDAGNSNFEFSNLNENDPIIVSGWIEPSRKYPGVKAVMNDKLKNWSKPESKLPTAQNVAYSTEGKWEIVSYSADIAGGKQFNIESHLVESGTWIHLHLSIFSKTSSATELHRLRELLRSFTLDRKNISG